MNTKKEASELWCPMVRMAQSFDDGNASNCGDPAKMRNPSYARCIASKCAMWRWSSGEIARRFHNAPSELSGAQTEEEAGGRRGYIPLSWEFIPAEDDGALWLEPESEAAARRTGYCGLAGMGGLT